MSKNSDYEAKRAELAKAIKQENAKRQGEARNLDKAVAKKLAEMVKK